jgi:hypothetical protein
MSNKRITDLTELPNPTTDDVFPVVDIATNTTTKVQLGNLPVPSSVTTALATKQDSLVSGTNIKTINSTTLLGSGDVAVQPTLVSGTNIKTLNNTSLLGSGNITLTANPSGVSGAIQFSNGSAFASDAANFFWDDTNNRLGVGTNAPTQALEIAGGSILLSNAQSLKFKNTAGTAFDVLRLFSDNAVYLDSPGDVTIRPGAGIGTIFAKSSGNIGFGESAPSARVHIKGSGATSATTSLLVQDSTGQEMFRVRDNNQIDFRAGQLSWINPAANCWRAVNGGSSPNVVGTHWLQSGNFIINDGTSLSNFNSSVMLGVVSTTKGFLPPVMTTTQKNAISAIAGLVVYDSTTNKLCCYNGSTWNDLF